MSAVALALVATAIPTERSAPEHATSAMALARPAPQAGRSLSIGRRVDGGVGIETAGLRAGTRGWADDAKPNENGPPLDADDPISSRLSGDVRSELGFALDANDPLAGMPDPASAERTENGSPLDANDPLADTLAESSAGWTEIGPALNADDPNAREHAEHGADSVRLGPLLNANVPPKDGVPIASRSQTTAIRHKSKPD